MFTGIVARIGRVREVARAAAGKRVRLAPEGDFGPYLTGSSMACSGVCLTLVEHGPDGFAVDVSGETLSRTTLGDWRTGTRVNLERPLSLGEELGGHFVLGHVDGVAAVARVARDGDSRRVTLQAPNALAPLIAQKGSVTLDGVSLTVNEVEQNRFVVNLIPHTLAVTTLGAVTAGTRLNLEVDPLARHVARLSGFELPR